MSKHETRSPIVPGGVSEIPSFSHAGGAKPASARPSALGEIGFVGLGNMGRPMAANLAAAGRRVIAYVRRSDQFGELKALGLNPTTDIGDLLDCDVVISMLPDDDAVSEAVFGATHADLDGLPPGLLPPATHLSLIPITPP